MLRQRSRTADRVSKRGHSLVHRLVAATQPGRDRLPQRGPHDLDDTAEFSVPVVEANEEQVHPFSTDILSLPRGHRIVGHHEDVRDFGWGRHRGRSVRELAENLDELGVLGSDVETNDGPTTSAHRAVDSLFDAHASNPSSLRLIALKP